MTTEPPRLDNNSKTSADGSAAKNQPSRFAWYSQSSRGMKVLAIASVSINLVVVVALASSAMYLNKRFYSDVPPIKQVANAAYTSFPVATSLVVASRYALKHMPTERRRLLADQSKRSMVNMQRILVGLEDGAHGIRIDLGKHLAEDSFKRSSAEALLNRAGRHRALALQALDNEILELLSMLKVEERRWLSDALKVPPPMRGWQSRFATHESNGYKKYENGK